METDSSSRIVSAGGTLVNRSRWNAVASQFASAEKQFLELARQNFSKRIARRFGEGFFRNFAQKLLSPDAFLEDYERRRMISAVPWLKKKPMIKERTSKFKDIGDMEKYPIGSIEK